MSRAFLPVALIAVLATSLPLAEASLTDSLWVPGICDSGDYDDLLPLTAQGRLPTATLARIPAVGPYGGVPPQATAPSASPHRSPLPQRGPPPA